MPDAHDTPALARTARVAPEDVTPGAKVPGSSDEAERPTPGAADDPQAALEELRWRDPYYDPPLSAPVQGHGPAHPAGRAARELGRLVAAYRESRGLTQAALGERLGWPQPNVARLEAGHRTPDLATLDRLARRLGLEVSVRATPKGIAVDLREPAA